VFKTICLPLLDSKLLACNNDFDSSGIDGKFEHVFVSLRHICTH